MLHFPFFRRKLAHRLRNCAARRRQASGANPSGEDLKTIDLFARLARDAEQVPQDIVDSVAQRCLDPAFARRFEIAWDSVDDVVGTMLVPRSAAELIRWMVSQADYGPGSDGGGSRAALSRPGHTLAQVSRSMPASGPPGLMISVVSDFTSALAVVGPALSLWEGSTAIGQWRDHAYARSHPQRPATVVDTTAAGGGRSGPPSAMQTIRFTPADGQAACTIAVSQGAGPPAFVGQVLTIVPRSGLCEPPLVLAAIGDPTTSATIALAFLASGIASLKVWRWLQSRPRPRASVECSSRITMGAAL